MSNAHYSYKGKGRIHLRKKGTEGALWREIGNCSTLEFSVEESTEEMLDYRDAGGGTLESDTQITRVAGTVTCYNMSPDNIALGLRGSVTNRAATAITGEKVIANLGSITPFARFQDMNETLTVTSVDEGALPEDPDVITTYDVGDDYTRTRGGIIIPAGSAITAGLELTVSYTPLEDSIVQAMTSAADEYEILFDGLNDAKSGKPVRLYCHKAKWSPTKGLSMITDSYGTQELEFTVLSDDAIIGAGLSRYMTVEVAHV